MKPEEIKEMFKLSAEMRKLGPFDQKRQKLEDRFFELDAQYRAEYIDGLEHESAQHAENTSNSDWKAALHYIANVLMQFSNAVPETKKMNEQAFATVASIVTKSFEGKEK